MILLQSALSSALPELNEAGAAACSRRRRRTLCRACRAAHIALLAPLSLIALLGYFLKDSAVINSCACVGGAESGGGGGVRINQSRWPSVSPRHEISALVAHRSPAPRYIHRTSVRKCWGVVFSCTRRSSACSRHASSCASAAPLSPPCRVARPHSGHVRGHRCSLAMRAVHVAREDWPSLRISRLTSPGKPPLSPRPMMSSTARRLQRPRALRASAVLSFHMLVGNFCDLAHTARACNCAWGRRTLLCASFARRPRVQFFDLRLCTAVGIVSDLDHIPLSHNDPLAASLAPSDAYFLAACTRLFLSLSLF